MKKIILLFALVLSSALYQATNAQVGINVNIGSQPVWGPSGYDYAEYYYFPDMDVYYHVPDRQFVYCDHGNWVSSYSLPGFYSKYNLYNSYKVVINEPRPFLKNIFWRSRYSSFRGRTQETIYNSRDPRYFVINEHPQHARWMADRGNDRRYNDNTPGNFGRNDNRQNDDRRNDDHRYDDRRYDNRRDNNQRWNDMTRNDNKRNDNRRWNDNNQRGNDNGRNYGQRRY